MQMFFVDLVDKNSKYNWYFARLKFSIKIFCVIILISIQHIRSGYSVESNLNSISKGKIFIN